MEVETIAIGCMPQGPAIMGLGIVSDPKVGGSGGQGDEPAPRDQHSAHLQDREAIGEESISRFSMISIAPDALPVMTLYPAFHSKRVSLVLCPWSFHSGRATF